MLLNKTNIELNDNWLTENYTHWDRCFITEKSVTKTPLVYIFIPKNASTTVKLTLGLPENYARDCDKLHLKTTFSEVAHYNYPKFVVVRNPFDRVISSFFQLAEVRKGHTNADETLQTEWYHAFIRNNIKKSFNLFLDYINYRFYDEHIYPQFEFLKRKGLTLDDIEYVLLVDRLDEGFGELFKILGLDLQIKKGNLRVPLIMPNNSPKIISFFHYLTNRDILIAKKIRKIFSSVSVYCSFEKLKQKQQISLLKQKRNYEVLHNLVDNNQKVRQKIQKTYHNDCILYEKAKKRAL